MRFLLFSDLHAKNCSNPSNNILQDTLNILNEIYEACGEYDVDAVLFGGDCFHIRRTISVTTFNAVYEAFGRIRTRVLHFGMLVGNHDQVDKEGETYSAYAFGTMLSVMGNAGWYTFDGYGEKVNIFALPFHEEKEVLLKSLRDGVALAPAGQKICLAHLGISGARVGSNYVLVSPDNLTVNAFSGCFLQTFLGHYHEPQELIPTVQYLGATHQHNWGDAGQRRGFWLWDTPEGDASEYEKPTFFETKSAPKFLRVDANKMPSPASLTGHYVKIVYQEEPDPHKWEEAKNLLLKKVGVRHASYEYVDTEHQLSEKDDEFRPGRDFEDMIVSYVNKVDIGNLSKNQLISMGKSLVRNAQ